MVTSQYKISAKAVGNQLRIKFPMAEGMAEWTKEELCAEFHRPRHDDPQELLDGWYYHLPLNRDSVSRLFRTAPFLVVADSAVEGLRDLADKPLDLDHWTSAGLPDPSTIPQPARRRFDAWGHQRQAFHFARQRRCRAMLAMKMGTGKTKVFCDLAANDVLAGVVLIHCPARVLDVWRGQIPIHAPAGSLALILDDEAGSVADKVRAAEQFIARASLPMNSGKLAFVVINYESAIRPQWKKFAWNMQWKMVGLDESHRAKCPTSQIAKYLEVLRKRSDRRVLLTGTPMPHSPADIYSQVRFIDPSIFGPSFTAFKRRYCVTGMFREIVGWRHREELSKKFHSVAICIGEEVLDLPEMQIIDRPFPIPPGTRKVYREVWQDFISEVAGGVIAVDNALVKMLRCQQLGCGFAALNNDLTGKAEPKQIDDAREQELADLLDDTNPREKVVVFYRFKHDAEAIRRVIERREFELNDCRLGDTETKINRELEGSWQRYRCGTIDDLTPEGKLSSDFDIWAIQCQSGSVGVDFTAAAIGVLYSISFAGGDYEQMLKRIHRPGQKRKVTIVRLIARNSIDGKIFDAIRQGRDVVASILHAAANGELLDS